MRLSLISLAGAVLLVLCCVAGAWAQRISVDSLEQNGYRVRIYKPAIARVRTVTRDIHDTIVKTVIQIVVIRDTVTRDRIALLERTTESVRVEVGQMHEKFSLMLIGNANTNGYGMHLGAQLQLGGRIAFFIGGGMGYNSVTKLTHLDLAGLLTIRLWERPE